MRIIPLEQRTADWLTWRATGLGGSDAAAIVSLSPWTSALALWRQKCKKRDDQAGRENSAMARGRNLEPRIAALYTRTTGIATTPVCCQHDDYPWLKASLDGWNGELRLVSEYKAPKKADHEAALAGEVPEHYSPQVDHLLLVTGASCCHYVSYNDYFPARQQLAIVPCRPDAARLALLLEAELEFWEWVRAGRCPLEGPPAA